VKTLLCLAVLACAVLAPPLAVAGFARTEAGEVRGVRQGDLEIYKAIPFAAPPVGDLRWKPPAPVTAWTGVRQARDFAPACMQTGVSMPGETPPRISEDCLYLNIWAPARRTVAPLPVMVFIHGGGFTNGSAAMPLYWGDKLARHGVIVVTFGYRVGPFGFLARPELTRESPNHASGNYGILDQIAALEWVKRNIAAFGGDPGRVTIFGQSAGAMSVSILAASPLASHLFQGAIAESGGVFEPLELAPGWLLPKAEVAGEAFGAARGAKSLTELRALPASRILTGDVAAVSHPVLDGYVLTQSPYAVFAEGRQADVPMLVGSNEEEARALVELDKVKAATFTADIEKAWGDLPPTLLAPYPHAKDEEAKAARAHFERDLRFGWDMWAWARLQAATGHKGVYYYHFTRAPPFPSPSVYSGWGPSHYAELWYVFDHLNQEPWRWTAADRALATAMSTYWTNFAKTGDPNGHGVPVWPKFSASGQVIHLGDTMTLGGVADLPSLKVFDAVYAQVRGIMPPPPPGPSNPPR
jgi:para-nitrobenzyl esterase